MRAPTAEGYVIGPVFAQRAAKGASAMPLAHTISLAIESLGVRLDPDSDPPVLVMPRGRVASAHEVLASLADLGLSQQLGVEDRLDGTTMVAALDLVRDRLVARQAAGQPAPPDPHAAISLHVREESSSSRWPGHADEGAVSVRPRSRWWG